MAGDRKENSVLFSLKELKDITSDEPEAPVRARAAAPAPVRRSSALDDKDDLLADLRSSVAADAEAEAARLDASRRASQEQEQRRVHETATLQRAEIDARIAAEQARRRAAEDERTQRARQIDLDERRARGEIVDEPVPAGPVEMPHHAAHAPVQSQIPQQMVPQQPQGRGTGFYLTVVGLPVMCITAVAMALIMTQKEPLPPVAPMEPVVVNVQPSVPVTAAPTQAPASVAAAVEPVAAEPDAVKKPGKRPGGKTPGGGGAKPPAGPAGTAAKKPGLAIDINAE